MLPLVSKQRREQALRFTHVHGRYCCLKSYLMLTELLGAVYPELDYVLPEFAYTAEGKPYLPGRPDIHFSISHTKNAILVALSGEPIGADIEMLRTPSEGLLEKTMSDEERRQIAASAEEGAAFTALWTRKEAVLKLRGTGILGELHSVLEGSEEAITKVNTRKGYAFSIAQYHLPTAY